MLVNSNLLFTKVIGEIGDHDLVLRWDSILGGATLARLAWRTRLVLLRNGITCHGSCSLVLNILSISSLGGCVGERQDASVGDSVGLSTGLFQAFALLEL